MPNSFFSSVDRNGVDIKLWKSETFFLVNLEDIWSHLKENFQLLIKPTHLIFLQMTPKIFLANLKVSHLKVWYQHHSCLLNMRMSLPFCINHEINHLKCTR